MSTLTSSSTLAQIEAAYADNASYAEDDSLAKAKLFETACRLLIFKLPRSAGHGDAQVTLNDLRDELRDVQSWIAQKGSNTTNPGVIHADFTEFRS